MTDDIARLFETASPVAEPAHREAVWQQVAAQAAGGQGDSDGPAAPPNSGVPNPSSTDRPTTLGKPPTVLQPPRSIPLPSIPLRSTELPGGHGGTVDLDVLPSNVVPLRSRRPKYLAVAAASVALLGLAGMATANRNDRVTMQASATTTATTSVVSTAPPTTVAKPATTAPPPVSTTPPTTAAPATTTPPTSAPATTTVPKTTSTATKPTTTTTSTTTPPHSHGAPISLDAMKLGNPESAAGTVVATFDGVVVGDIYTTLDRTPEGGLYYAGFNADRSTFFVQFFADGNRAAVRYDLPSSFLRKAADGFNLYDGWVVGPDRVLYGSKRTADGHGIAAIVVVPTTGPKASSIVATSTMTTAPVSYCGRSTAGIVCQLSKGGSTPLLQPWLDPAGSPIKETKSDATWLNGVGDPTEAFYSAMLTDDPISVTLPDGRALTLTNLRPWVQATPDHPLAVSVTLSRRTDTETCVVADVGWEGVGTRFATCITTDGAISTKIFGQPMGSLPGGNLDVLTDRAYYAVQEAGTRFNLVRYDYIKS